jgi:hypothetical protein
MPETFQISNLDRARRKLADTFGTTSAAFILPDALAWHCIDIGLHPYCPYPRAALIGLIAVDYGAGV